MTALLRDHKIFTGIAPRRPNEENPFDPNCKLHLQRICGTCVHYQGELKPARNGHNLAAYKSAPCDHFGTKKHRRNSAAKCPQWTRKAAAQ